MLRILWLVLSFSVAFELQAQPFNDEFFDFHFLENCLPVDHDLQIFSKVEVDPIIHSMSEGQFMALLHSWVESMGLKNDVAGALKLKVLFPVDGRACLRSIGFHGNTLDRRLSVDNLPADLRLIEAHSPGLQRQIPVLCQGLVFVSIKKGEIDSVRIANLGFERA